MSSSNIVVKGSRLEREGEGRPELPGVRRGDGE